MTHAAMDFELVARPWAELVFHVLAHVPSPTSASLHDASYVAFVARHLGPADERSLAEDARTLAAFATDHRRYASLQRLAWLFVRVEEDTRVADRELRALDSGDVRDSALLSELVRLGPVVEVLRCAAELEGDAHSKLPGFTLDTRALERAMVDVSPAAPALREFRIGIVRALGVRGRVRGREIWVGAPGAEAGPTLAHVAWQAAHEATVAELERDLASPVMDDRPLERAALVLLEERSARVGLAREHAMWLAHFGPKLPPLDAATLPEDWRRRVVELLARA